MFCNCIEKGSYTKLNDRNQQKGDDSFCFTKIHETKRHCEYPDCIDCLLGKLEKEIWILLIFITKVPLGGYSRIQNNFALGPIYWV